MEVVVALKTSQSINGFIASDPRLTFNDDGQARLYARIGINHFRREEDGSFTELEPSFHDLIQFGKGAELSAERFRKGDNFLAQGYVRDYTRVVDGQERTDEQFVTKRLAHDPNITTYHVERRARSNERDAPAAERDAASHNGTRAHQSVVAAASDVLGF
jgi:single-stranded DNA-binding protein